MKRKEENGMGAKRGTKDQRPHLPSTSHISQNAQSVSKSIVSIDAGLTFSNIPPPRRPTAANRLFKTAP
jgi:hypothetical protein